MAPPELAYDIVGEILLRIPPDDPALLLRASLVCKPWRRLLTDPVFLRRYRAFHRTPPLLGFFCTSTLRKLSTDPTFVPTSAFRPRGPNRRNCRLLDCRHGCVLLYDSKTKGLLVWDPINGEDHHIPNNAEISLSELSLSRSSYNAAVLCAAADCDHLSCHGGPFLVVLVIICLIDEDEDIDGYVGFESSVFVYSSVSGVWSAPTTVKVDNEYYTIAQRSPVLTGDKIYFVCESVEEILCYDLQDDRGLSVITTPVQTDIYNTNSIVLVPVEDGGLRIASLEYSKIVLWSLEMMDPDGVPAWTRHGIIHFNAPASGVSQLNPEFRMAIMRPRNLSGFANTPIGSVLFLNTIAGIYMIELESQKIRKVDDKSCIEGSIFAYTSFVTPDCAVGRLSLPSQ